MTSKIELPRSTYQKIAELEQQLRQLKRSLFQEQQRESSVSFPLSALVVSLKEYFFALPLQKVEEVSYMVIVSPLPGAPPSIRGVIDYRGRMVPVLDLSVGFSEEALCLRPELYLAIISSKDRLYALPVHSICGVSVFEATDIEKMSNTAALPAFVECLLHSDNGAVTLLDTAKLLAAGECDLLDQAMSEAISGELNESAG